jgi:hypothetical protein
MDPDLHESDTGPKPYRDQEVSGIRSTYWTQSDTVIHSSKMAENVPPEGEDNNTFLALLLAFIHRWLVSCYLPYGCTQKNSEDTVP